MTYGAVKMDTRTDLAFELHWLFISAIGQTISDLAEYPNDIGKKYGKNDEPAKADFTFPHVVRRLLRQRGQGQYVLC